MSSNRCDTPYCHRRGTVRPVLVVRDSDGVELGRNDVDVRFCDPCGLMIRVPHLFTEINWRAVMNDYILQGKPGANPNQSGIELVTIPRKQPRTLRSL